MNLFKSITVFNHKMYSIRKFRFIEHFVITGGYLNNIVLLEFITFNADKCKINEKFKIIY